MNGFSKSDLHQRTLTSLAILKVDIDEGNRDYLDYLCTFSIQAIRSKDLSPISEDNLSQALLSELGLRIPRRVCQLAIRRLVRTNSVIKEHGAFFIAPNAKSDDFQKKKHSAEKKIKAAHDELIKYALVAHEVEWSTEDASRAILAFYGKYGVDFLKSYAFKTALPELPGPTDKEAYIVGKFISDAHGINSPVFESFSVIFKGHMYANALVCPDLDGIQKKFDRVVFYLDTPLAISALGLHGDSEKLAIIEMVELIKKLRGKVHIFSHTLEEVQNVIGYAEENLSNATRTSRILSSARAAKLGRSDLISMLGQIPEKLEEVGIHVEKTPTYGSKAQIGESDLEDRIRKSVKQRNERAYQYDINSIRCIYELRYSHIPARLEDSRAIFVTDNDALARVAFEFGKTHNSSKEVSSVITDFSLANIAWLKAPMGAPSLPERELLSACFAALEPTASLFEKYLQKIDALREGGSLSADEHALLRFSPVASAELMGLTLGSEAGLTTHNIQEILARVKADIGAEKDKDIAAADGARISAEESARSAIDKNEASRAKVFWYCSRIAGALANVAILAFYLVLVSFLVLSSTLLPVWISSKIPFTAAISFAFVAGCWALYSWKTGLSIDGLRDSMQAKLAKIFHTKLTSMLGL